MDGFTQVVYLAASPLAGENFEEFAEDLASRRRGTSMAAPLRCVTRSVIRSWSSPRGQVGSFSQPVPEGGVMVVILPKKHSIGFTGEDGSR